MADDDANTDERGRDVRRQEFEHWMNATGLTVDSDMRYAMHDSLYSNPDQADAYEEAGKLNVDGLAYAIWKLGWEYQVDGWVYDEELGWQPEATLRAIHEYEERESAVSREPENEVGELVLNDFANPADEDTPGSDEAWVYYMSPKGEGWQNMADPYDVRYQRRRPGPAPAGGDGHDDYLTGWRGPPEDASELSEGQLLEVTLGDREPEAAVVTGVSDEAVTICTDSLDYLFADNDSITVSAVEDTDSADSVAVPEWAERHRDH